MQDATETPSTIKVQCSNGETIALKANHWKVTQGYLLVSDRTERTETRVTGFGPWKRTVEETVECFASAAIFYPGSWNRAWEPCTEVSITAPGAYAPFMGSPEPQLNPYTRVPVPADTPTREYSGPGSFTMPSPAETRDEKV